MLKMRNGFELTDNDCMQCRKDLGNRKFLFIQKIYLDSDEAYCVVADTEDLTDMSLKDIENAICGYYDSISEMEESYDLPLGQLDDVIAECNFESRPYCDWKYQSKTVSWERAEAIIQTFIDSNGYIFWEK